MGNEFTAKVKIKRKRLPSSPINVKISATPEENAEGGKFGSSSPAAADKAAFSGLPSSQAPKFKVKTPSGRKGSYK